MQWLFITCSIDLTLLPFFMIWNSQYEKWMWWQMLPWLNVLKWNSFPWSNSPKISNIILEPFQTGPCSLKQSWQSYGESLKSPLCSKDFPKNWHFPQFIMIQEYLCLQFIEHLRMNKLVRLNQSKVFTWMWKCQQLKILCKLKILILICYKRHCNVCPLKLWLDKV